MSLTNRPWRFGWGIAAGVIAAVITLMGIAFRRGSVLDIRDTLDLRAALEGEGLRLSGGMTHSGAAVREVRTLRSGDRLYVLVFIVPVTTTLTKGTFDVTVPLSVPTQAVWFGDPEGQRTIGTVWKCRVRVPVWGASTEGRSAKVWPR